jgi:ribosome-binding factor A
VPTLEQDYMSLKDEYRKLFQQREDIQSRMNAIEKELPKEVRQALVREIEDPQLGKLK